MPPDPKDDAATLASRLGSLEARNAKLEVLLETARLLSAELSIEGLIGLVLHETTRVLGAERSSIFLVDKVNQQLWSLVAQGVDETIIRFPMDRGIAGHVARTGEVVNIADVARDPRFNAEVDRRTGYQTRSLLAAPLKNRGGEVLGVVEALNKKSGQPFDGDDVELLLALASQAAVGIENAQLYERIEKVFEAFVGTIVAAIDARDPTTAGHSHRVAAYSLNLARAAHHATGGGLAEVSFSREQLRALRYAAILHDVGKIGVRERVLCKRYTLLVPELGLVEERVRRAAAEAELRRLADPVADRTGEAAFLERLLRLVVERRYPAPLAPGQADDLEQARRLGLLTDRQFQCFMLTEGNLSDDEWRDMRGHALSSYELLAQIPWPEALQRVPVIAGTHHEKLDGSGYPRGLKGTDIPFEGQILAVADIYDALTASDRPYKRSYTHDEAGRLLAEEVGRGHVDRRLVRLFFDASCHELPLDVPRPPSAPPPDPEL